MSRCPDICISSCIRSGMPSSRLAPRGGRDGIFRSTHLLSFPLFSAAGSSAWDPAASFFGLSISPSAERERLNFKGKRRRGSAQMPEIPTSCPTSRQKKRPILSASCTKSGAYFAGKLKNRSASRGRGTAHRAGGALRFPPRGRRTLPAVLGAAGCKAHRALLFCPPTLLLRRGLPRG